MSRMNRVLEINRHKMTLTAQAGLQVIAASKALRAQSLQLRTNIEIGNMTLGSAACCHTKDALDGIEFGQVNSYVTRIKWVTPSGDLAEASEDGNADLLHLVRSSYGLCGIVYGVTIKVKRLEAARLMYSTLRQYLEFTETHFQKYGFRCNMPLGSYYVRQNSNSLLSYTGGGDVFSIDPIHAYPDKAAWDWFLGEFNDFAAMRNGIPLLNQSPFVTRRHVEAAYGSRWRQFSDWVRMVDPSGRMLNPLFGDLLS